MQVLIDTNILIDVFAKREPHFEASASVLRRCGAKLTGCLLASQTTDVFYILRRETKDAALATEIVKTLSDNLTVLDVNAADVKAALESEMLDYEDALLACRAKRAKADYIITRNVKDFQLSPVQAIRPTEFLGKFRFAP
jgi:predicted nucleic acid-binding protein